MLQKSYEKSCDFKNVLALGNLGIPDFWTYDKRVKKLRKTLENLITIKHVQKIGLVLQLSLRILFWLLVQTWETV